MDQTEFQSRLEHRICQEFAGISNRAFRYLWCDGVGFGAFVLDDPKPRLLGSAWICSGNEQQEEWRVELLLPGRLSSRDEINWSELLPAEDVTRWLGVDFEKRLIQIEPTAAVPDLE